MGFGGEQQQVGNKGRKISLEELSQVRCADEKWWRSDVFGIRSADSPVPFIALQHRTPEDAWMTYKGKVYDVSGWEEHPGALFFSSHFVFFSPTAWQFYVSHFFPHFRRFGDFHARW